MKKKNSPPDEEPLVVPQEILRKAKLALDEDRLHLAAKKCSICGGEAAPNVAVGVDEVLCWVCRRLKISAWRDSDPQIAIQE